MLEKPIFADEVEWDEAEEASESEDERPAGKPAVRAHRTAHDTLYGALPISRWAQALLETEPFARLDGVSLSDTPGELLFKRPFPSRLTHSLGVYYLARQARPRDRALQAAALAHDLGHGPFSHLSEPLMIERLGIDHEQRGVSRLREALAELTGASARLLAWLDPDEVAALMLGGGPAGRGALLNGLMDYDNLDNVARFLQAAALGEPSYDARALARDLRLVGSSDGAGAQHVPPVALSADAGPHARAWLADRRRVYRYLGEGERNQALHGMLRKSVELAEQAGLLTDTFFDLTDGQALRLLRDGGATGYTTGAAALAQAALRDTLYATVWSATTPVVLEPLASVFALWRTRLALEEQVAQEAGLFPHQVVLTLTTARGDRELPPLLVNDRSRAESLTTRDDQPSSAPTQTLRLLIAPGIGRDYVRRARMAAERALGALGAITQSGGEYR